jgi:hypothetical protein
MCGQIFRPAGVSLSQLETGPGQRAGKLGLLQQSTRSGKKNAHLSTPYPLERLNALARYFGVRLDLSETFSRWVKRDKPRVPQRLEISQPPLGT